MIELHFTNIDQGLITFYITVIILAALTYLSARYSEYLDAPKHRRSK